MKMLTSNATRILKCSSESPEKHINDSKSKKNVNGSTTSLNDCCKSTNNYKFSNSDLYDYNESYKSLEANHKFDMICNEESQKDEEFDGLMFKDQSNSGQTMKILNALRKNRQLCDLILQLDDDSQDIYCHQIILACNSKFFMEIFTNYELEQANRNSGILVEENEETNQTGSEESKLSSIRKKSLQTIVNKNHNSTQRQLLFCLSDYLKHFLKDNNHHHYAKLNSIINHNSPYHHHYNHHGNISNHNHHFDAIPTTHDEKNHHINLNMDYEALKICIDYMYTSRLKVPSYLIPHVYTLAYHLSFENIVNACAEHLTKNLSVDNCLGIRSFALDESLIQASTQCIEKNIEYILELKPLIRSSSSSLSSSTNNLNSKNETNFNLNQETLSSTVNLAHKELNQLPRINIELVGLQPNKAKLPENIVVLNQLCMNWLVDELVEKCEHSLNDLCDHMSMLYINTNDHTLHDCCDMDSADTNFNDHINDYQKQYNTGSNGSSSPPIPNLNGKTSLLPNSSTRLKTFKITDQELNAIGTATPIKFKILHDNELICTHQVSENSFITICTLTGKLVTIRVHIFCNNHKWDENKTDSDENRREVNSDVDLKAKNGICSDTNNNNESNNSLDHLNQQLTFDRKLSSNSSVEFERLAKMRLPRCSHGAIAYKNKLYIFGGYERGECLNLCEVYDPKTNTIVEITPMESRRGRAAIAWLERTKSIYVLGGSDGHEDLNSIECFDLNNQKWTSIKFDFELGFTNLAAVGCDRFIYLVGLKGDVNKTVSRTCCLRYEPENNSFKRLADLNYGRSQSGLVWTSVHNKNDESKMDYFLYVFGGYDSMRCLNSCEVYNVQEDKWVMINNMYEPRRGCGAAFHKESQLIYIVGGTNGTQSLKSIEIYDIKTKKWTSGPELNIARNNVAIEFIGDVLFAIGGFDGKSFVKTIEYLNVKNLTNGWSLYHKQSDFECINDIKND